MTDLLDLLSRLDAALKQRSFLLERHSELITEWKRTKVRPDSGQLSCVRDSIVLNKQIISTLRAAVENAPKAVAE